MCLALSLVVVRVALKAGSSVAVKVVMLVVAMAACLVGWTVLCWAVSWVAVLVDEKVDSLEHEKVDSKAESWVGAMVVMLVVATVACLVDWTGFYWAVSWVAD